MARPHPFTALTAEWTARTPKVVGILWWAKDARALNLSRQTVPPRTAALHGHLQAQALESERVAQDAAVVDNAIRSDLGDPASVEDVVAPPCRRELRPCPRVSGRGRAEMFGDLPGGAGAQRYGPADCAQSAVMVVAAEDEELRAGEVPVIASVVSRLLILIEPR
ncbi:hypothetical protein [Streptomyces sp. NPDC086989]|uniref:hypothetical protein n=1 Tax=Streptomyces sp. NPDC086989 TaxID=3365764 RepID=UPI00381ABC74